MKRNKTLLLAGAAALSLAAGHAYADQLQDVLNSEKSSGRALAQAQDQIDSLSAQTDNLVADYREVVAEIETLKTYNGQIRALVNQQESDITLLDRQIDNITLVKRQVMPLIQDMLSSLRQAVEQDLPFRQKERLDRVAALEALLIEPEVVESERYRLVLERYETEADYGSTLESWPGDVEVDGVTQTVNFLRVGRVSLMYQTQTESQDSYWWDPDAGAWVELDGSYNSAIQQAIQMSQQAVRVDLVQLPLPAPKEAQ
ncbi:MAG: DUF3450 domain-containing protein [Alphaproteobacteria bacterium]